MQHDANKGPIPVIGTSEYMSKEKPDQTWVHVQSAGIIKDNSKEGKSGAPETQNATQRKNESRLPIGSLLGLRLLDFFPGNRVIADNKCLGTQINIG